MKFKKSNLRFIAAILAICFMLFAFASCDNSDTQPTEAPTGSSESKGTETQTSTEATTGAAELEQLYESMPYAEEAGSISINGVNIEEYRIVIPADANLYTKFAAQNLADYLQTNANIRLETVTDAEAEETHELVIGDTNREGSIIAKSETLEPMEYIMMLDGESVIFYGESYMVGGAAGAFISRKCLAAWKGLDVNITDIPTTPIPTEFEFKTAKNAVLLIGDGMGNNHIDMTLANGLDKFSARDMPNHGWQVTSSYSVVHHGAGYTDSAAAGTALATGYKTINGYVGLDHNGQVVKNVREMAYEAGAKTAILSTDAQIGATPAAFLAHVSNRSDTAGINEDIAALKEENKVDYVYGSLGDDDFLEATVKSLQGISKQGSTFFAMIEEGYIDKWAHSNNAENVIHCVKRFDTVIAYCMEFALFHPDTMIFVTADHETGGLTYDEDTDTYDFTSANHTNVDVPVYAMGGGSDRLFDDSNEYMMDNTDISYFLQDLYLED